MEIRIRKLPKSQIELEIEIPAASFVEFTDKAILNLGEKIKIKGFRPGKASKEIILKEVGIESVLNEAAHIIIDNTFKKAIKEKNLEPISHPEVTITKLAQSNPFCYKAVFSVLPEIELPDYKKIADGAESKEVIVGEKEVDETLDWLMKSRGKTELNDEFARSMGKFENLEELKKSVREGLEFAKKAEEGNRKREEIMSRIGKECSFEIPEPLIEVEKERRLADLKNWLEEAKIGMVDYLAKIKKTEEEFLKTVRLEAEKAIKGFLILRQIAKKENIVLTEEEIKQEISKFLAQYPDAKTAQKQIDLERLKSYTEERMRNEKVLELLENLNN